jgi:hypothetical protein
VTQRTSERPPQARFARGWRTHPLTREFAVSPAEFAISPAEFAISPAEFAISPAESVRLLAREDASALAMAAARARGIGAEIGI